MTQLHPRHSIFSPAHITPDSCRQPEQTTSSNCALIWSGPPSQNETALPSMSASVRRSDINPPCRFFNRGECRNGTDCPFSHAAHTNAIQDNAGRNVCKNFLLGLCNFDDACFFAHTLDYIPAEALHLDLTPTDAHNHLLQEMNLHSALIRPNDSLCATADSCESDSETNCSDSDISIPSSGPQTPANAIQTLTLPTNASYCDTLEPGAKTHQEGRLSWLDLRRAQDDSEHYQIRREREDNEIFENGWSRAEYEEMRYATRYGE
ncbi:hypothetical protein BKA62DRAFT_682237 [Auriculariales sp. MPI-PUGE-AT-0066]|nr:hypothetical protein BKA62DRAFT_682237 [Auriculariales sp. MPI-PUGE-AT-0066]